jgi:hypothetical protein
MEKLEIKTRVKSREPHYTQNLDSVTTFLRHDEDKIIVEDAEVVIIQVIHNGKVIFNGDKYELFKILEK